MPRAKLPKKEPIETFTFNDDGETVTAEVWNNRADVGTRGMHKLKLRDDVFNSQSTNWLDHSWLAIDHWGDY